ncbi:MAG TPA: glycosyltransferase family 2 protein [Chloroflexota bacterium]|nr:glycosyltransferase family 2 protein [Chloroflexota bacterium]
MMTDLAIVIVNYNVRDLLRMCLRSIAASVSDLRIQVWVVDNASTDGSAGMVRDEFPQSELREAANRGFAHGNNLALREILARAGEAGLPRYVLLLNPDTELPPTALAEMVRFLDARPEAGAAGPRLLLRDGSLDLACRRGFPTPLVSFFHFSGLGKLFPRSRRFGRYNMTFLDPTAVAEVDSVVGAFMLVRGEVLRRVGLLDESFFMYGEDLDWALRIKQAGWTVLYNGEVVVHHYKRASSRQRNTQSLVAFYQAMLIFFRKHYAPRTIPPIRWLVVAAIYARANVALTLSGARPRVGF